MSNKYKNVVLKNLPVLITFWIFD